jgi:hypothetical protein
MFNGDTERLPYGMSRGCIVLCVNPRRDARLRVRARIRPHRDLVDSGAKVARTGSDGGHARCLS